MPNSIKKPTAKENLGKRTYYSIVVGLMSFLALTSYSATKLKYDVVQQKGLTCESMSNDDEAVIRCSLASLIK